MFHGINSQSVVIVHGRRRRAHGHHDVTWAGMEADSPCDLSYVKPDCGKGTGATRYITAGSRTCVVALQQRLFVDLEHRERNTEQDLRDRGEQALDCEAKRTCV